MKSLNCIQESIRGEHRDGRREERDRGRGETERVHVSENMQL